MRFMKIVKPPAYTRQPAHREAPSTAGEDRDHRAERRRPNGAWRRTTVLVALAFAAACGSAAPAPAVAVPAALPVAADPALGTRVDAVIDRALAEQVAVGVVVMIARDGKLVYARAAGFADREAGVAMREDTQLRLASMTKPIVSVAALALID